MTVEADLVTTLKTVAAAVFADAAPSGTPAPWVTYQHIGGRPLRHVDNTAAALRHSMVQVTVWAGSRGQAMAMVRAIEEALCAAGAFTARPMGEPIGDAAPELKPPLYGAMQDFEIWSAR